MTVRATAALGFAPHSGWSAVVSVGGPGSPPHVLLRERVELADARLPGSRQPYHAVEGRPIPEAQERLEGFAATAEAMARQGIEWLLGRLAGDAYRVVGVGILESAGGKERSLADTLASHALIHAADGDHFRNAIAGAARTCGLAVWRVRGRDLDADAATCLGRPAADLHRAVAALGRAVGPPWAADQKAAALLAWLVLARTSAIGRGFGRRVER